MPCLIALLALLSPRLALFFVFLFSDMLSRAFDSWLLPLIGFFLLPWTTLAYAVMWDTGTTTVDGFERFIAWTHRERASGRYVCFAVVPGGLETAIGIFPIRRLEAGFATAEWGFAIGEPFWGTGVFEDAAKATIEFAFETVGITRLEARAAVVNGRGTGALAKVGAVREAVLRKSFLRRGEYLDQALWTILADDWMDAKAVWGPRVVH